VSFRNYDYSANAATVALREKRKSTKSGLAKFTGTVNHTGMELFKTIKRRLGSVILTGVVAYCVVYAIAFIQLYRMEHPYKVASQWIFANVPAGSRIVSPHWDDKVPVGIPGKDTAIYQMNGREYELPLYERDTAQMIGMIVNRIAGADYITFATPRAVDSIPRIPDEYPNTTALLRLLWAEKIGFKLVHTTKNRPTILGFTFNDDLADESFSVYDHPKVVIFKNEQRLSAEQIIERIKNVQQYEPLPSMNEMLLMDTGGWVPTERLWRPEWNFYVKALAIAVLLGFSAWIVVGRGLSFFPDGGLGLCMLLGVVGAAFIGWGLSALRVVPLTATGGSFIVLLLMVLAALKLILRESTRSRVVEVAKTHGLAVLLSICVGGVVAEVMRHSDTAVLGLSDRVDAAYLSYLMRTDENRPWDLLQPGQRISPVLADRFALGWLLKVAGAPTSTALQISFFIIGGLAAAALYSLIVLLARRSNMALVGVLIAIVPAVYLLNVACDIRNKPLAAMFAEAQVAGSEQLGEWMRQRISATPLIVEACDHDGKLSVSSEIGLPRYAEAVGSADLQLCRIEDPEQAYHRMMGLKLELFVTPSGVAAASPSARNRYERFAGRPDLFAKVFDNQQLALFVPSFSRYYPLAAPLYLSPQ
jgi:hypothetical protein